MTRLSFFSTRYSFCSLFLNLKQGRPDWELRPPRGHPLGNPEVLADPVYWAGALSPCNLEENRKFYKFYRIKITIILADLVLPLKLFF